MYTKIEYYKNSKTCSCTKLILMYSQENLKYKMQKYVVTFFFIVFIHLETSKNKVNSYRYHYFDYDVVESNYSYFPNLLIQFV